MDEFNQFTIPFGKYIDPNTLGTLELIKHIVAEENLPIVDQLYLIKDTANNDYYCALEPELGSQIEPKEAMETFVKAELGDNARIELLEPKSEDWLLTHYLARVVQ